MIESTRTPPSSREFLFSRDVITIVGSLFFSAMGANAFVQYVIPYLVEVRTWPDGMATMVLVLAFGSMPIFRFTYAIMQRHLGDYGSLVVGHLLFLLYLVLLARVDGLWVPVVAALALAIGATLVFTTGPLQILDATPAAFHGRASGIFFGSNFLAWFLGILLQGVVIRGYGFSASPYAAFLLTLVALAGLILVPRRAIVREPVSPREAIAPLGIPLVRLVAFLMLISSLAFGLMFGVLGQYVTHVYGAAQLSLLVGGFYLARLPGSLLAGALADRWGLKPVLVSVFLLTGMSLFVASWNQALPVFMVMIVVLGFQQAAVPVVAMTLVGNTSHSASRHITFAPVFAASEVGVAVALVFSYLLQELVMELGGVLLAFGCLFVAGALAASRLRPGV
jgi:predicted MFS family arabinose efflux permease